MFTHPWAIPIAAMAVALPVLIHWLTRPRPVRMPLSTIRFVREAVAERRARHRLRDWIVLALRAAAIALIGLAIARPRQGDEPLVSDGGTEESVRVVILDASQSLAALDRGADLFQRARTVAAGHLRYRSGLRANLIVAGARPRTVVIAPSQNFESLREVLDRAEVLPEGLDANRALVLAAEMLAPTSESDRRRRELVVVSDFQRNNWARADFSVLPADTRLQLESVAPAKPAANAAVLSAKLRGRATASAPSQLAVEIGNYFPAAQRITAVATLGETMVRLEGLCAAGRRTTLVQEVRFAAPGWQTGEVKIVGISDALAADDRRPLAVEVSDAPVYALVTREPASRRPSASHFLECALAPEARAGTAAATRVLRVDPAALDRQELTGTDLIAIDHPGTLSGEAVTLLAGLLRRGWPVLYVAADAADARNLQALATAAGGGLSLPVDLAPPASGQRRSEAFLANVRTDSAPFRVFGDNALAMARQLSFSGGLATRRVSGSLDDDVLATYSDGTACLVVAGSDAGTLAILNADLGSSSLPRTEMFVPLMDDLVGRLLERGRSSPEAVCGQPLVARLPIAAASADLTIAGPSDAPAGADLGQLADEGAGVVWSWPAPSQPGVYRIQHDDQTAFAIAVGIAEEESQLESLPGDVLTGRLAAGHSVFFRAADGADQSRDTFWVWMAVGCVLCLLGEVGALLGFRS
jgi:hypothetical protein